MTDKRQTSGRQAAADKEYKNKKNYNNKNNNKNNNNNNKNNNINNKINNNINNIINNNYTVLSGLKNRQRSGKLILIICR